MWWGEGDSRVNIKGTKDVFFFHPISYKSFKRQTLELCYLDDPGTQGFQKYTWDGIV